MNLQPHGTKGRRIGLVAMTGGLILLGGCLIIPVSYHTPGSRHNVTGPTTNLFQIGISTREDILLALGEPDYASVDGQRLGYRWSKVKILLIGGNSGEEFVHSYLIEASFDPSNRVSRVRFLKQWGESVTPIHDSEAPPKIGRPVHAPQPAPPASARPLSPVFIRASVMAQTTAGGAKPSR